MNPLDADPGRVILAIIVVIGALAIFVLLIFVTIVSKGRRTTARFRGRGSNSAAGYEGVPYDAAGAASNRDRGDSDGGRDSGNDGNGGGSDSGGGGYSGGDSGGGSGDGGGGGGGGGD